MLPYIFLNCILEKTAHERKVCLRCYWRRGKPFNFINKKLSWFRDFFSTFLCFMNLFRNMIFKFNKKPSRVFCANFFFSRRKKVCKYGGRFFYRNSPLFE